MSVEGVRMRAVLRDVQTQSLIDLELSAQIVLGVRGSAGRSSVKHLKGARSFAGRSVVNGWVAV